MKIAICINEVTRGGVGTSTYILCQGMRGVGQQADILATNGRIGNDYDRALCDSWPVEAICIGQRWLRRRLEITLERLSHYDVVINNHSIETQLLLPTLPASTIRLSVIRSTNAPVIEGAKLQSPYLDALVGISPEVDRLLGAARVKCLTRVIPNAVMVEGDKFPALSSPLKLIYLGRLTNVDKNILILPEIASVCKKRGLRFSLTVVGDGPDQSKLEEKIAHCDVGDCVKLLGSVPRQAVAEILGQMQFAILPSNYEGFGLTLVEAMSVGCVPITSKIPSYRWILGDDAKTLQAPVKDAKAYADRLCAIAKDPDRYKSLQQRLRHRQRENFTPESTVNGYLTLIENVRERRSEKQFVPVPLANMPLSKHYRRRCTRAWWLMQNVLYGLGK